jgi:hypothetical protein
MSKVGGEVKVGAALRGSVCVCVCGDAKVGRRVVVMQVVAVVVDVG